MHNILILILIFFPLTLIGQELDCCRSIKEVENHINGYWKMKSSKNNEQLRFEFNNGHGKFWRYTYNNKNELVKSKEIDQTLEIFKNESGFEMDWSNGSRIGSSKIKVLNSKSLVFMRRDGKETEYSKIIN
jgi:hypothetical protein